MHCTKLFLVLLFINYIYVPSWSQEVTKATNNYELHLKVLLTPIDPVAPFVQSYLLLLTDFSEEMFCKFLEIKGISRKHDQQRPFLDEFYKHIPPTPQELLFQSSQPAEILDTQPLPSLFSRLKSSFNVVNAIKRSYTRPIKNSPSTDGFLR